MDRGGRSLRFVLSGSTNPLLMRQISESLAGRAIDFILEPMALGEIHRAEPSDLLAHALDGRWPAEATLPEAPADPRPLLLRGLMPPLLCLPSPPDWVRWWDGYVATYLERDLRQAAHIDAILDFRRLMELTALRSARLVNQSELARDARLAQPTVHRWLNLLETTHLFERLPAYTASHTTRLLKSPKAFWNDPGLAVFLSGYFDVEHLGQARELGGYFETFIYHHLRVLARLMTPPARLSFWRTHTGCEVDFVFTHGRRTVAIEVKQTDSPGYNDAAGLRAFLGTHPAAVGGLLIHSGRIIRRLDENIVAVPWPVLTG